METGIPQGANRLIETAKRFPQAEFLFTESAFADNPAEPYPANAYFEMSRFQCCFRRTLVKFIDQVGADHVLFGSGAPFKEMEPALIKYHNIEKSAEDMELIAQGNFRRLLLER
jgi:predicted TIM-barrel fold metal-dependent hydrolase